jgi:hypothetical protein
MKKYILLGIALFTATILFAQQHKTDTAKKFKGNAMDMDMGDMQMDSMTTMSMNSQFSLDLPMNRDGSGTSWVPDETPIYAYMIQGKKWTTMIHGSFFARYNNQDLFKQGSRGGKKVDVPDWFMVMTQRKVGNNGLFAINTMFSFDPFLVVSASFGYPGEPALGPPVFMHRLSAINDPDAPLGHHYQDATHITFGVATLGFRYKDVKLEGSVFTGREPDEFRYNFDPMRFDSYSVRLSYNPSKEWALQVSNGWIHSPEVTEPLQNVDRFTVSAINTKILNENSYIASTLVYGQNHYSDNGKTLPSILLENSLQLNKWAIYDRYEFVKKDAEELNLTGDFPANPNFNINAITLGANRIISTFKQTNLTAGVQATLNASPAPLRPLYGSAPLGFEVYIRISPALMKMKKGDTMDM